MALVGPQRTWLVTGSSRGLGRSICNAILERGDNLVATARNIEPLQDLVTAAPDSAALFTVDVTDPFSVDAAVALAIERFGHLDVVVNNAGYAEFGAFEDTSDEIFRRQMEVNFFGVVNVSRAAIPHFRAQRSGYLIQISSIVAMMSGVPGLAAYQAGKFALEGFSESLAKELADFGVHVVLVEPGSFRTGFIQPSSIPTGTAYERSVGRQRSYRESNAGRQVGDPANVGRVIADIPSWADPPLRLLLGRDAFERASLHCQSLLEEMKEWSEVSLSDQLLLDDGD